MRGRNQCRGKRDGVVGTPAISNDDQICILCTADALLDTPLSVQRQDGDAKGGLD